MLRKKEELALKEQLQSFQVPAPDEDKINETLQKLQGYLPLEKRTRLNSFSQIVKHAWEEVRLIRSYYWMISFTLFIVGYLLTITAQLDPLPMLIILAPFPFVLGVIEVFRGREEGILELEMACRFSAYEIILSRLLIISVYNIGLSLVLTLVYSPLLSKALWKMILLWSAPLLLFAVIALSLSMRFRGHAFVVTVITFWVVFSGFVLFNEGLMISYFKVNPILQMAIIGLGIILLLIQIKRLTNNYRTLEGTEVYEINN